MPDPLGGTRDSRTEERGRGLMLPALIYGTSVLVTLEFIVIGILPLLAESLDVTLNEAGWLVSAFAISAATLGPLAILLASDWQPRTSLALGLLLVGISSVIPTWTPSFWLLLSARIIQGACLTHFVSVASATAARVAGKKNASRAIGHVNLGVILGTVFAVPLGVALAENIGSTAIFTGLGLLAGAGAGAVYGFTPVIRMETRSSPQSAVLRKPYFLLHLLLSGLLFTAMFASYSYIAGYLEMAGLFGRQVALVLFGFGAAGIIGNWLASRRVGEAPIAVTMLVSLILVLITACLPLSSGSIFSLTAIILVWGAAHTAAFVACQVRVMFAEDSDPAFAASLNISVCNLGIALGAVIGGNVMSMLGIAAIGLGTVVVGTLAIVVGAVLWIFSKNRSETGALA